MNEDSKTDIKSLIKEEMSIKASIKENRKADQLHVGLYFLKTELLEFEKAATNRTAWFGWLGMLLSSAAALYATKPTDQVWLIGWAALICLSFYKFAETAYTAWKLREFTVSEFLRRVQDDGDSEDVKKNDTK